MRVRRTVLTVALAVLVVGGGTAFALTSVDGDAVPTYRELADGSDPFAGDTDGDGLRDGEEGEYGTDPTNPDTDGDGLLDGDEVYGPGRAGGSADLDGHGGSTEHPSISWTDADPTSPDTDGDGIRDGAEADAGLDPTSADSDGDGIDDPTERDGPTDPVNADTDGDNLLDGWEVAGRTDEGAALPDADPLHRDIYLQVLYLRGVDHRVPPRVFSDARQWFAEMPVENPDGETGIRLHVAADGEYSGPIDRSIDEWHHPDGGTTQGVSGFMAMREFYNRETIGPRTGSYFLVVVAGEDVPVRGSGNAGGTKVSIVRPWPGQGDARQWAHTITHELLHNLVQRVGGQDCNGQMHTCEGFLSYENEYFLSDVAAKKLNEEGFADPVYPEQMNATTCADTISDRSECGA